MKKYIGKIVTDIVLVGSIDIESSHAEVSINHEFLFIEIEGEFWLRLASIGQMSELKIDEYSNLKFDFEIDEDDKYTSVSIKDLVVIDTISDFVISEVDEYRHGGKFKAVEIYFSSGQTFFIDATFYTGIKFGAEALKKVFLENNEGFFRT
jgi:hypothetical protein